MSIYEEIEIIKTIIKNESEWWMRVYIKCNNMAYI
jgi:hypothetical protein